MIVKAFWSRITIDQDTAEWQIWFEEGNTSESLAMINPSIKRAIIIHYTPEDNHPYAMWVDKFSDDPNYPNDTVEQWVICYRDVDSVLESAKALFNDWQRVDVSYCEMQRRLEVFLG